MKKLILFFIALALIFFPAGAHAVVSPLSSPNNLYGIHILSEGDIPAAAKLVNSSGGTWGYVTLVIEDGDRDVAKWQEIFDSLRRYRLIPLVRLATHAEDGGWAKPRPEDAVAWSQFLNSLNWVVKNRYVVLFNEPNHAQEWGGEVKPEEYVAVAAAFSRELKAASDDFFVLPAGLDAAAPDSASTMTLLTYLSWAFDYDPNFFTHFDGWTSHSYPNPDFSGSPAATGLGSVESFKSELNYLSRFGVGPNLPVFITETGWAHNQEKVLGAHTPQAVADYFTTAFTQIWQDPRVVAVTPFVLNYPQDPFGRFSWQKPEGSFYPQFEAVKNLDKPAGDPEQIHYGQFADAVLPDKLVVDYHYAFSFKIKNLGQSIWDKENYSLNFATNLPAGSISVSPLPVTEPFAEAKLNLVVATPDVPGEYNLSLQLQKDGLVFGDKFVTHFTVVSRPSFLDAFLHPVATFNLYCPTASC
ncbi:MAG: hypothetical protein UX85_C0001G0286 [Candidatus Beckwithbacteria bacterium GW2011_GWB1_47_15]|uniref:Glycoside hydrolase family 5 domain-containing protein n=1 Tax=Candidatus Beckwithbacteria bacterium GW2011_GWB1_47_15 TaxID=1618371 RepID=A0A0G1RY93_9BACT|nr:MAG: hypothetical protein UY43_C0001G0839 [Candidatus Beckwithbacteria bacterium GW2011_GWC1_49_16]KKU36108.1 MAG: hypothetical protein UX50_C0001G0285 [Candidatus Beckwithbacteria bacterium GW2011_GWA1_46_30]KKU62072.1 MAG: hypothetical protein UX85_C0001G0286 [Candidatus Beckwithbacteria bacterium GW2011_GWB1_47_15]KKU72375.1 MAG: hypothetical protein UX97_C0001G0245 [Candidatus Beckwithbacteria bacterium GW2011_GWA2_47_25]OGD49283.1 MAG: hypothetical protein A2877_04260 [Candidatus Beckwi